MSYFAAAGLTFLAFFLALLIGRRWAFPVLSGGAVYFPFAFEIRNSNSSAFLILLLWAFLLSALLLFFSLRQPDRMQKLIWRSKEYSNTMFDWIQTGRLPEGSTVSIIIFHARQTVLYCLLALISANVLSLMLGAALLNYMNFYVARLALQSKNKSLAVFMGWNPWSIIRVVSFLWLGVVLAQPIISPGSFAYWQVLAGVAGAIFDLVLKIRLSPFWRSRLKHNLTY